MGEIHRVMVLVGTRPEVVKMAPVVMELHRRSEFECVLISTGQHREMLHQALEVFGLVPDEAPSLGKPVLVMRDTTERPEGVDAGTARLVGTNVECICAEAATLMNDPAEYDRRARIANPYGDGQAAQRIVELLTCP